MLSDYILLAYFVHCRYYEDKYKRKDLEEGGGLTRMCQSYVEGLCWVLKYYYDGCPSWNWYYPFHYAPFASDLVNIDKMVISFTLSEPFHPLEQLLAVLPPESAHALPESCRWLMLQPSSPIIDLYDSDIPIDPNGKHLPWLWVLLIPFVDERRITAAMKLCLDEMTEEDKILNSWGKPLIFLCDAHPVCCLAKPLLERIDGKRSMLSANASDYVDVNAAQTSQDKIYVPSSDGDGMAGTICVPPLKKQCQIGATIVAPRDPIGVYSNIVGNRATCLTFLVPQDGPHISQLLPGVLTDPPALTAIDILPRRPPRLNKGFNLADLGAAQGDRARGQGYGQQQYQQQQQQYQQYQQRHTDYDDGMSSQRYLDNNQRHQNRNNSNDAAARVIYNSLRSSHSDTTRSLKNNIAISYPSRDTQAPKGYGAGISYAPARREAPSTGIIYPSRPAPGRGGYSSYDHSTSFVASSRRPFESPVQHFSDSRLPPYPMLHASVPARGRVPMTAPLPYAPIRPSSQPSWLAGPRGPPHVRPAIPVPSMQAMQMQLAQTINRYQPNTNQQPLMLQRGVSPTNYTGHPPPQSYEQQRQPRPSYNQGPPRNSGGSGHSYSRDPRLR